jgi:hypothetical protein
VLIHGQLGENAQDVAATFDGWIDEVALFNRVLEPSEIEALGRLP